MAEKDPLARYVAAAQRDKETIRRLFAQPCQALEKYTGQHLEDESFDTYRLCRMGVNSRCLPSNLQRRKYQPEVSDIAEQYETDDEAEDGD